MVTEATRTKFAEAARRRWADPAERERQSERLKVSHHKSVGSSNPQWKGDDVSYLAVHKRLHRILPRVCSVEDESCKGPIQVALKHDAPDAGIRTCPEQGLRYSTRVEDYWSLCASHHRRYDDERRKR